MKTPKDYAHELIERFTYRCTECDYIDNATRCAMIALEHQRDLANTYAEHLGIDHDIWHLAQLEYFDKVKEEIEKA